jgi:hypothetical protein
MWTPWRHCCGCCCTDRLQWCEVAVGTRTWRRRSTTSSTPTRDYVWSLLQLFFRCTVRLVVTIHDPLLVSFLGWLSRSSVSIGYPFPYNCIRAVLHSLRSRSCTYTWYVMLRFIWWIYYCMTWLDQSRLKLIASCDWMINSRSFSVVRETCLYRLESPSGLIVCIISRLSQQIEVMCRDLLMKIEAF